MKLSNDSFFMLIDDNEIDLFLNKRFLSLSGISDRCISFTSAIYALDYLHQYIHQPEFLPEIILLDIQMPEMDGFEFLHVLQRDPNLVNLSSRIILLSSTTDPKDIQRAENNGRVSGILSKPLNTEELKMHLAIRA